MLSTILHASFTYVIWQWDKTEKKYFSQFLSVTRNHNQQCTDSKYNNSFKPSDACIHTGTFTLPRTFKCANPSRADSKKKKDKDNVWMIPILFQSDLKQVHIKAGFTDQGE